MSRALSIAMGLSLGAMTAVADDTPNLPNPYALPKKAGAAIDTRRLDGALVRGVADKVLECLATEQGAPVDDEDRDLVKDFGSAIVRDLASALKYTSCDLAKAATPKCLETVSTLDCASFAEPIVAAGWDRNLSKQARAQVLAYAKALALKEASCNGLTGEEAAIITGVRADKLAVLIESEIVIGKCTMLPDQQTACDEQLADTECDNFAEIHGRGELTSLCTDLYECSDVPLDEPEEAPESEPPADPPAPPK